MIRTKLLLPFTAIFFSLLSWHCTKIDTTDVGGGLIPAVDNINTFETTLNVVTNNFDSVGFSKGCAVVYPTDDHALGTITNDPIFGTTKATIYTEFKPSFYPFYLPAKPADRTLDSIVLVLNYRRTFGDSTLPQTANVFEISSNFSPDTSTCSSYPYSGISLGSATYIPQNLKDSFKGKLLGDTSTFVLRIQLSAALGQRFLSQDSSANSAFVSDSSFKVFFKGFAIVPGASGNALSYFSLTDPRTRLALYYKYKRTGLLDTAVVTNFVFNTISNSANNIVRTHTGTELSQNLAPAPAGHNNIYIQTSPGTYAELKIPGLTTLSNRIVHRAELIVEQATPNPTDPFTTPDILYVDLKVNDTLYHPVPCDFVTSSGQPDFSTFGGFRTTANGVSRYTFNLTRYVQKIITNKRENSTLRLSAPNYVTTTNTAYIDECGQAVPPIIFTLNTVAYGRVKLVGGSAAPNRIRLHIVYSNL